MPKTEVKPVDNLWFNFSQGALNVLGKEEMEVHGDLNRLYYGSGIEFGMVQWDVNAVPFVNLRDLNKLERFSLDYQKLSFNTEAKRTITGGLLIRRRDNYKNYSRFSRKEFKTIEQYL